MSIVTLMDEMEHIAFERSHFDSHEKSKPLTFSLSQHIKFAKNYHKSSSGNENLQLENG